LGSVDIDFLEQKLSSFWDLDIHKEEIFDFSKESDKDWVEVDSNESHLSLFSIEQEFVELIFSVLFNSVLPLNDLLLVILLQVFAEGDIKLLDILELFSILDRLREHGKFLHWLIDSLKKTVSPVECTGDWRQVLENWSFLIR
jgi:hypothetical protein